MLRLVEGSFVQWNGGNSDASHSHIVGLLNAMTIDDVEALPPRPLRSPAGVPCRIKGRTREGLQVSPPASSSAAHQAQPRRSE
jgi:hypothetical protein